MYLRLTGMGKHGDELKRVECFIAYLDLEERVCVCSDCMFKHDPAKLQGTAA